MTRSLHPASVTAVLGPTNTGKTHYAVERMLARSSGVIGLPLRLLAREVYDKICRLKGPRLCALITGEEKIVPPGAAYFVCTVEAMPQDRVFAFVAVDEVQLMSHPERGHIFTDRVLHMRGVEETLLLGAETARSLIRDLLPDARHDTRERFSTLSYGGHKKLTRLPKRSVIVAFSAPEVYAIAELIRRFRGGAAIVMGALSPRTRNAQAALYQDGEVDFLVATDAVGMGLNLEADHVAFASLRKFDGRRRRYLHPAEAGQIAGRAGRFRNDGTFGTTSDCVPMDDETVARIVNHAFDPLRSAEWRNSDLDFASTDALLDSLAASSPHRRLRRAAPASDEAALERLAADPEVQKTLGIPSMVKRLWDVCQIPDFRNQTIDNHIKLLADIYERLIKGGGKLDEDFLGPHIARLDHTDGGVDILSARLAQIRTWTYCANKISWMKDAEYWIKQTRAVEDRLSDALHETLTARFVDRRTGALLKSMGSGAAMDTSIKDNGDVYAGDHLIGTLKGVSFTPDMGGSELEAKTISETARQALAPEINRRLTSLCAAQHAVFTLSEAGQVMWGGHPVGQVAKSGSIFNPDVSLVGGELGDANLRSLAEDRMRDWLRSEVSTKLQCLSSLRDLSKSDDERIRKEAKGFAFRLLENDGHIDRKAEGALVRGLDQETRKQIREAGVVFGQYDVYMRALMKPKPANLLSVLSAYGAGGDSKPFIPFSGVTSLENKDEMSSGHYSREAIARAGYRVCGPRIIRFDILNRLGALIRQAQVEAGTRRFQVMQEMLALMGCTYDDLRGVLETLGYKSHVLEAGSEAPEDIPELTAEVSDTFKAHGRSARPHRQKQVPNKVEEKAEPVQAEAATEGTADAPAVSEPAEAKGPVSAETKPDAKTLNIYHHRETAEDGTVTATVNNEYWYLPFPKKGHNRRNAGGRPQGGRHKGRRKGGPKGQFTQNKPNRREHREQRRMEDSPFAALAALKNQGKTD